MSKKLLPDPKWAIFPVEVLERFRADLSKIDIIMNESVKINKDLVNECDELEILLEEIRTQYITKVDELELRVAELEKRP